MNAFGVLLSAALLASPAVAQDSAPAAPQAAPQAAAPAPSGERRLLNLNLEEPAYSQPRITFGAPDGKGEQRPADTLPSLGGSPSPAYERPIKADAPGSPFPKDTNPTR
jgi:hypothetical protein